MDFKLELIRYSHTVGESALHLQFTPAYRRDIFVDLQVRKLTELYFLAQAKRLIVVVAGIGFGKDHVHIFVCNWKNYSIAQLVKYFKGYTSRMMRKNHWNMFRHDLWGDKFWSEGYFHRTVGSVSKKAMEYYIKKSQQKHWEPLDYEIYKQKKQLTLQTFSSGNAPHFSAG